MLTQDQVRYIQENFKVPVDKDLHPQQTWIASLGLESEMPTDDELHQLRSYIEFVLLRGGIFQPSYGQMVIDKSLPLEQGCNTVIFRKGYLDKKGWFYRRSTWQVGPMFVPSILEKGFHPHTLIKVIGREIFGFKSREAKWAEWKREHPDIFPITEL